MKIKREDMMEILHLRSFWKITGMNYKLPSGNPLSEYLMDLLKSQMEIDHLAIAEDGNFYPSIYDKEKNEYNIMVGAGLPDEIVDWVDEYSRREKFISKLVGIEFDPDDQEAE